MFGIGVSPSGKAYFGGSMFKNLIYGGYTYDNFLINENGEIKNTKTNHKYKNSTGKSGYLMVYLPLGKRGKIKAIRVHKAVAETFLPNPKNYPIVHHKDEDRANPKVENLEWTTSKGNTEYHLIEASKKTEFYNNRKLTQENVRFIRKQSGNISRNKMAKMFGVSKTTITNITKGYLYQNII